MRRNLFPLFAALAVCGAVTAGVVASTAHAQPQPGKARPVMIALVSSAAALDSAAPPSDPGAPPPHMMAPPQQPPRDGARIGMLCQDMYARQVGDLAYLGARLNLTAAQTPLFDRWKQVQLDAAKRRQGECAAQIADRGKRLKQTQPPTMLDQMTREQQMLKTRLADLDAERPALEALYASLSAAQKRQLHPRDIGRSMAGMGPRRMFAQLGPQDRPMGYPGMAPGMMGAPLGAPPPGDAPPQ